MTNTERNRSSRRTTFAALGVSGALHVAALLWVTLPVPELSAPADRLALMPRLSEPVLLDFAAVTPTVAVVAPATAAEAGGAGMPGATDAAPPRPAPQAAAPEAPVAPRPVAGEQFTLAALDSLANADRIAQPVVEPEPLVVAALPEGALAGSGHAAEPTAPAAPAHVPGSAARAKGGGAKAGAGGSGDSGGFGGITIKIGGGGPKKHPPRGMPGRGRW
jgi:hypothetical protein